MPPFTTLTPHMRFLVDETFNYPTHESEGTISDIDLKALLQHIEAILRAETKVTSFVFTIARKG